MSAAHGSRKVAVEIQITGENRSWVQVGSRTVYHYWAQLNPHYRGVLLPPQRKTDGQSVAWTWAQSTDARPPSGEEIKALRRKLSESHRHFVDAVGEGLTGAPFSAEDAEELRARMGRIVANLVSLPEREVLGYIASTLQGYQFHSWGAPTPGRESFPDDEVLSIRGRIRQGESPVPGAEVTLEDADGRTLDETRADSSGTYGFYKLKPGSYRVKASSSRVSLPPEGIPVELRDAPVPDADVVASEPAEKVDVGDPIGASPKTPVRTDSPSGNGRRSLWLLALLLLAGVAGVAWWQWGGAGADGATHKTASTPVPGGVNSARTTAEANVRQTNETPGRKATGGAGHDSSWSNHDERRPLAGRVAEAQLEEFDSSKRVRPGSSSSSGDVDAKQAGPEGGLPGEEEAAQPPDSTATSAKGAAPSPVPGSNTKNNEPRTKPVNAPTGGQKLPASGGGAQEKPFAKESDTASAKSGAERAGAKPAQKKSGSAQTVGGDESLMPAVTGGSDESEQASGGYARDEEAGPSDGGDNERVATQSGKANRASKQVRRTHPGSPAPTADETPPPHETADASLPASGGGRDEPRAAKPVEERWQSTLILGFRPWTAVYRRDSIIPTQPFSNGEPDLAPALYSARWAAVRNARPATFSSTGVVAGLNFVVRDNAAMPPFRWTVVGAAKPSVLSVSGARAEVGWATGAPNATSQLVLRDARNREWLRLRTTAAGELSLEQREGVEALAWASVARAGPERRRLWLMNGSESLLPGSQETPSSARHRVEVPLELFAEDGRMSIASHDAESGWALQGDWTLRQSRPPTP